MCALHTREKSAFYKGALSYFVRPVKSNMMFHKTVVLLDN